MINFNSIIEYHGEGAPNVATEFLKGMMGFVIAETVTIGGDTLAQVFFEDGCVRFVNMANIKLKPNTTQIKEDNMNTTFITYSADDEIIVTTPELEEKTIEEYFWNPKNRDISEYDRVEHKGEAITVSPSVRVRWS